MWKKYIRVNDEGLGKMGWILIAGFGNSGIEKCWGQYFVCVLKSQDPWVCWVFTTRGNMFSVGNKIFVEWKEFIGCMNIGSRQCSASFDQEQSGYF